MTRYHINKHGVPAVCKAKPGNCPLGGDDQHFTNIEEAQDYADTLNEDKYGLFKNVDSNVKYVIPENTPKETIINHENFIKNNHKLVKSEDNWVHLDENNNVIGTMKDPIAIYDDDGELLEIADVENYSNKMSIQGIKALKSLARFNLVSKDIVKATSSINFYSPNEDIDEYKDASIEERRKDHINSFNSFKKRIEIKGGFNSKHLFRNNNNSNSISSFFSNLEKSEENLVTNPKPFHYDPKINSWKEIPSARKFSLSAWKTNNLDVQRINDKWIVSDSKGNVYGRLENPAVAINFSTESIDKIGEHEDVKLACEKAKESKDTKEDIDKLGSLKFDENNNSLEKVDDLLGYSWAFNEEE